ncbi:MAG: glucuronate isomerase [Muribaculaceae bacterium]|nr:glucuronate isomerase [Muribaculaceae bacterium]
MEQFMTADFLLTTPTARELYHDHASRLPIIDYHCHLDPALIAADRPFGSITELWLGGDHYKWRALRSNGVAERFITGSDTSDWEKFEKWAATVPYTFRNPLYHWTHLELRTAFGIDETLNPESARRIFDECNMQLRTRPDMTPRGLMRRYGVETVCTTDDPADTLEHHLAIRNSGFEIKVLPTWRPDKAMAVENPALYGEYISRLSEVSGVRITSFAKLAEALQRRHDFFAEAGCRLSDHGLEEFYAEDYSAADIDRIFADVLAGRVVPEADVRRFKSAMLVLFGEMDHASDWAQQFHYGTIRNSNTRMMRAIGPDTGFDSIGEFNTATSCARFLDRLDSREKLPRTILYNLNPAANEVMATMIGNFQDGSVPGKIQFGSGWWFNDQIDGMRRQMNTLSLLGLLSRFVGMLTDSRSFLSYPRHEYFRRTLCDLVGADVEAGLIPYTGYEKQRVQQMIEDICYNNAKNYFKF